jgi:translation initiation factor 1
MKAEKGKSNLVYSTDGGIMCPSCRQPLGRCLCQQASTRIASDCTVRVSLESKGRGGKSVTLIKGLPLNAVELVALGKTLKSACGSGGTSKNGMIEVQGDHRDRVMSLLIEQGWTVKRAGG